MKAEIITIGDEILIGQIVDTNSAWIAQKLNNLGIDIIQITSVPDQKQHIHNALSDASKRVKLVLITGGLGPTSDDITKPTLCEFFNTHLVMDLSVLHDVENLLKARNVKMIELNRKQAEVPENCTVLQNLTGTAPGMWFEKDGVIYVSMPGVPFEMMHIMEQRVLPKLEKLSGNAIIHKTMITVGMAESALAEQLKEWESELPGFIRLAYLPSPGQVKLRLSARGSDKVKLENEIAQQVAKLIKVIPSVVTSQEDEPLEVVVGNLLRKNNNTLSTAESCTGGNIARLITSIAGSSDYFKGSVVAYANEMKIKILGVSAEDIDKNGAVSQPVVEQMAKGVLNLTGSNYSIAISGIAGPTGGTPEKPVGTVWIAIAGKDFVYSEKFLFGDNRERNIARASMAALNLFRKKILAFAL